MKSSRMMSVGVGGDSGLAEVEGVPVFVKRIPLTDLELLNPTCTANLFDLPMFCQYGIGGPGFNAWRELAANVAVTDAVLTGQTQSFPILYHWRVLPGRAPVADEHVDIDAAVTALGGSSAVRARLEALATATCSLMLFCEYIPYPITHWLRVSPADKARALERQLSEIVSFLSDRELLHMDGHFGNIRTDMERIYLSDFGLATSPRFDLSSAERDFVTRHATHDSAYAAMRLVNWLVAEVCGVPRVDPVTTHDAFIRQCANGRTPHAVPPSIAAILARYAPTAAKMNAFYGKLFHGDLDAEYPGL